VVVWTGRGASYSWVWWADLLEDLWWLKASFRTDPLELLDDLERGTRTLLLGGGDVAALRAALDWDRIRTWVEGGGQLVATCAGAYLLRDWVGAGIANVADSPPERTPERAWTRCEGGIVVHPVRGPVSLRSSRGATFTAPVYGGPVFSEPEGELPMVEARYAGVTRGAVWLLADRPELLAGTPAIVSKQMGQGSTVLSGPHLEHPDHPAAHMWLAGYLGHEPGEPTEPSPAPRQGTEPTGEDIVRRLASVRGRAISISDVSWRSGEKVWNGQRVAGFTDSIIPRAKALARWGWAPRGQAGGLLQLLDEAERCIGARARPDIWDQGFATLSEATAVLLDAYFASRRAGMPAPPQRVKRPSRIAPEGGFNSPTVQPMTSKEVRRD
jgi:hypothetical protein